MVMPIPRLAEDNVAFWTGGREGHLNIMRCEDCGWRWHPPSPRCPSCFGEQVGAEAVSGQGHIYSFTINRRAWEPDLEVPYVIAIVELDEQPGLRLLTNIIDCAPDEVAIGRAVQASFIERGPVHLPVFRLVAND